MTNRGLFPHLLFAALSGLAVIPWTLVAGPLLGAPDAASMFAAGILVLYVAWLAPEPSRALAAGALAAVLGALSLLAGAAVDVPLLAIFALAIVLALVRSAFLYRRPAMRSLAVETALLTCGLLSAMFLADGSLLGLGLAFWGFFLVQSLFVLVGGAEMRPTEEPTEDPFVEARQRALALMEERL